MKLVEPGSRGQPLGGPDPLKHPSVYRPTDPPHECPPSPSPNALCGAATVVSPIMLLAVIWAPARSGDDHRGSDDLPLLRCLRGRLESLAQYRRVAARGGRPYDGTE